MNTQLYNEWRDATKANLNEPMPKPMPVIEVNPKLTKNLTTIFKLKSSSGADTVYITPINQDVLLYGFVFSFIKDATCDMADGEVGISYVQDDNQTKVIYISTLTLTAQNGTLSVMLPLPVKLQRGSIIYILNNSFTVGKMRRSVDLFVSIDEYSNA